MNRFGIYCHSSSLFPDVFSNSIFFFIFCEHPEFIDHFPGIHGVSISNHGIFHSFFNCFSGFFTYFPYFPWFFPWNFHLKPWSFHGFFPRFFFHRPHQRVQQPGVGLAWAWTPPVAPRGHSSWWPYCQVVGSWEHPPDGKS